MQKSKTFLTTLLSTLLIFTPIYPHTAQASATYTLPANLGMEKMTNVAKRRGLTHPAIQLAIEGLVGAIDWIMLEGTVIKYHPKPVPVPEGSSYNPNDLVYPVYDTKLKITVVYTNPTNACKKHLIQTYGDPEKYVTGYMFSHIGLLSCKFRDPSWHHESSIGWFPTQFKPTEYTLPLEAVLQEVINNAEKGNQASIDYLQSIADEIAKEEGKPTTEPKPTAPPTVKPDEKPKADEDAKPKEESKPEEEDKEKEDDKKKKCLPVTEPNIRMVLEPTTELTTQEDVSLPVIAIYVARIENGEHASRMPDMKVAENIIIEGHHRFIAAKLCGQEAPRRAGTIAPSQKDLAYPIKNIKISLTDKGNR